MRDVAAGTEPTAAVKSAQLVIGWRVITLGEVPAGQARSFMVKDGDGVALHDFAQQQGASFHQVAQQRQSAFGASTGGRLNDLPAAALTASFLSQLRQAQNYQSTFILPPGLDLSGAVERGGAFLFAWTPDSAPVASLNQFKPRRFARNTMWRIPVAVSP